MPDEPKTVEQPLPPINDEPQEIEVKLETGQVYKGKNQDEIIAQLVQAQEHASRRIKELGDERAEILAARQEPPKPAENGFDQARYWELMNKDPQQAFIYQQSHLLGVPPEEVPNAMRFVMTEAEESRMNREGRVFRDRHPEYPGDETSASAIRERMNSEKRAWTAENLETVYYKLRDENKIKPVAPEQTRGGYQPNVMPSLSGTSAGSPDITEQFEQMSAKDQEAYLRKIGAM